VQSDGEVALGGQGRESRIETPVGEHGGLDASGQVSELDKGRFGLLVGHIHQLPGLGWVGVELGPGPAQVHGHRHQLLLGAVVEVPLDPLALGEAGRDPSLSCLLGPGQPLRRGRSQQHPGQPNVDGGQRRDRIGGQEQQAQPRQRRQQRLPEGVDRDPGI
jgi:hypothetical protein